MEDFIYFLILRVDNSKAKFIRRIISQKKKNVALISYAILQKISLREDSGSNSGTQAKCNKYA